MIRTRRPDKAARSGRPALALFAALVSLLLPAWRAAAAPPLRESDDESLGSPGARVTVIEYASLGCPHCGAWALGVFPAFKARFIATGQVRYVLREEITGSAQLAAAGFLLARCAGPHHYFDVVDKVFGAQAQIFKTGDALGPLLAIAAGAGMTPAETKTCLTDKGALAALIARARRHADLDGVSQTPTFVVGGETLVGDQSLAQLAAAISAARRP